MSDFNLDKKSESLVDKVNLTSINSIIELILAAFRIPDTPVTPLPPPLLLGANTRPGITSSAIASRIISRQQEAGCVVGDVFADGPNTTEAMVKIMAEEIVNAILTEAKVEITIPPGIPVQTFGIGNLGLPVVSAGLTTSLASGVGVLR